MPDDPSELQALLFPGILNLSVKTSPLGDEGFLFPAEEAALSPRSAPGRWATFRAGRQAARQALKALGYPPVPILRAPSGAPQWPEGIIGSIAHTQAPGLAVAVATRRTVFAGIGIDVEPCLDLSDDVLDLVLTAKEREALRFQSSPRRGALVAFCAKESVYKVISQHAKRVVDFQEVEIRVTSSSYNHGIFIARCANEIRERYLKGTFCLTEDHCFSACAGKSDEIAFFVEQLE